MSMCFFCGKKIIGKYSRIVHNWTWSGFPQYKCNSCREDEKEQRTMKELWEKNEVK